MRPTQQLLIFSTHFITPTGKEASMPTRNSHLIGIIINLLNELLTDKHETTIRLESYFKDTCILNAGDVTKVAEFAVDLRLSVTTDECSQVLNYIAEKAMVGIT